MPKHSCDCTDYCVTVDGRRLQAENFAYSSNRKFYNPCMDHHTVAAVSITGTCLDVGGSLYLAYDLLGGQHGPLRLITRIVTYSIVFGVGYGIGLGAFFGLAAGMTIGITAAIELNRVARGLD